MDDKIREREKKSRLSETMGAIHEEKQFTDQKEKLLQQAKRLLRMNEELLAKNAELQHAIKERNELLGVISHDLKSPLTVIIGIYDVIKDFGIESFSQDELVAFFDDIGSCANQMFELVSKLLDLNRLEEGKMSLDFEVFELSSYVQQVIFDYYKLAQNKEIFIKFDPPLNKYLIYGDRSAVVQVLNNLLSNAIKYSPFHKNIYVNLSKEDGTVRCEIQDEGQGLTRADKEKLFQKFTRLSATPTGGEDSTGLGLSIVKKLVEAMHGNVWAESDGKGKGSRFIVEFPSVGSEV
jgi:signal transduction histidine kinase